VVADFVSLAKAVVLGGSVKITGSSMEGDMVRVGVEKSQVRSTSWPNTKCSVAKTRQGPAGRVCAKRIVRLLVKVETNRIGLTAKQRACERQQQSKSTAQRLITIMAEEQAAHHLLNVLEERGLDVDLDNILLGFEDEETKREAAVWVEEYLNEETLLTKEELDL
jgi:hypothetical protein